MITAALTVLAVAGLAVTWAACPAGAGTHQRPSRWRRARHATRRAWRNLRHHIWAPTKNRGFLPLRRHLPRRPPLTPEDAATIAWIGRVKAPPPTAATAAARARIAVLRRLILGAEARATRPWSDDTDAFRRIAGGF